MDFHVENYKYLHSIAVGSSAPLEKVTASIHQSIQEAAKKCINKGDTVFIQYQGTGLGFPLERNYSNNLVVGEPITKETYQQLEELVVAVNEQFLEDFEKALEDDHPLKTATSQTKLYLLSQVMKTTKSGKSVSLKPLGINGSVKTKPGTNELVFYDMWKVEGVPAIRGSEIGRLSFHEKWASTAEAIFQDHELENEFITHCLRNCENSVWFPWAERLYMLLVPFHIEGRDVYPMFKVTEDHTEIEVMGFSLVDDIITRTMLYAGGR